MRAITRRGWLGSATLALIALASCARGHVEGSRSYNGPSLPPPARVVVYDFAISPEEVHLNRAIGARLARGLSAESGAEQQVQVARATQAALAADLARRLQGYGLPVERAMLDQPAGPGPALLVQGQILSVDEGNRARRVLLGFGAGKSQITADAALYYVPPSGEPVSLAAFTAKSDSGRAPGMALPMGAGAEAGHLAASAALGGGLHAASEMRGAGDEQNAQRLANALARQIGDFAASQGWIPPSTVR